MKNKGKRKPIYSEAFKRAVMQEVLDGTITKEEARRKYGIKGKSTVLKWLRKYGYAKAPPGKSIQVKLPPVPDSEERARKQLEREIKQLKGRLSRSKEEALAWRKLVEVAERELGIGIRKKFSTKRSKK